MEVVAAVNGQNMTAPEGARGFTLIEALLALTVFAIGAVMLLPAMYAWVDANSLSIQRDEAMRVLAQAEDVLAYSSSGGEWDTDRDVADFETALAELDNVTYSTWRTFSPADMEINFTVQNAVVGVTDSGGNVKSRVMRLRANWDSPTGTNLSATRIVQRNGNIP